MNNMKQRLTGKILSMLFLLFAIGWTVNSSAQGVSLSTQDNGDGNKTLIVKAWGDLTNYTDRVATQKKWNKSAVNNVYSGSVGHEQTVNENQDVDETSATQYYTATKDYTLLFDGAPENGYYFYNVASTDSWDFSKSSGKHVYKVYASWDNTIHRSNEEEVSSSTTSFEKSSTFTYEGNTYSIYILSTNEIAKDAEVALSSVTLITLDDLNNYLLSTIVYTPQYNKDIYRSRNGGTPEPLTAGQQQTYEPGDKFYTATNEYHTIENFNDFLAEHKDYYTQNYETRNFVDIVALNLVSNGCNSIKFEQDASDEHKDDAIKITVDQLNSILNATYNNNGLLVDNSSFVDLSQLSSLETTDLSNLLTSFDKNNASLILPSTINSQDTKTFVDSKGWSFNVYWLSSDKLNLNVEVGNESKLKSVAEAKDGKTNTIVLYPMKGAHYYSASMFSNFDLDGVRNLVLHYLTTVDENTSKSLVTPNASDFENFSFIKRVILPRGINSNISTFKNTNSSVDVYEICNWNNNYQTGGKNVRTGTQINVLEPGALAAIADAHYTNDDIANGPCIDIFGAVNTADFTFISGINSKRINLSQMTFDPKDTNLYTEAEKKAAIDQISNPVLEYIALPDVGQETTDPQFKNLYDKNPELKGVAYYYQTGKSYTCKTLVPGSISILTAMTSSVTGGNVNIDSIKVSGSLNAKDISNTGNNAAGTIYFVDGHFVFGDELDASNQDGFRKFKTPQPEGAETEGAFSGSHGMIKIDLSDATFSNVDDATLSATDIIATRTTDVVIPTDVNFTNLPVDFLHVNGTNIKTICIPYNITHIGLRAFYGLTNLSKVTTTTEDGTVLDYGYDYQYQLQDVTNEETKTTYKDQVKTDKIDYSAGSIVFSKNLKEIDSYAFSSVEKIKDVYCLSEEAPICQVNAFGSNPCTGNNGFSPNGGITRSDFNTRADANGYIDKWIVMLHYPTSIQGTDLEKRYKDVTRDYTISDAEGHTDGQGNLLCWPNQSEFNRSYTQATNGYLWDAWKTDRTKWSNLGSYSLTHSSENTGYQVEQDTANEWYDDCKNSDKQGAIFYHTGYQTDGESVVRITDDTKDVDKGAWQKVKCSDPDKADKQLYDGDYRGWHQFVLCATSRAKGEDPGHNFRFINDNGWWTICVPFDMTKKEVCEMFGKGGKHGGPHVCEFTGVERTNPDADKENGSILLKFDRDVYNNVYKKDADNKNTLEVERKTNDDDIVIHEGVPYMLQPDFDVKDDGSLRTPFAPGDQIFRSEKCKAKTSLKLRSLARNNFVDVLALDKDGNAVKDANTYDYHYYFIGNFWQTEMPQYAYFLAWYYPTDEQVKEGFSPNGFATYFWQKEKPAQTLNWNAFTAIIGSQWSKDDRKFFVPDGELGNIHWYTRKGNDVKGGSVFADDSFNTSTSAKRGNSPENVSFSFGGDNTADGITKVHFGDQTLDVYNGKVYNLNGQYVGDSLENLPKGIYIAGGKKYVVK